MASAQAALDPPRIEVITTGDELLSGLVVDTNAAWLSARLREAGYQVRRRHTVGDDTGALRALLAPGAEAYDLVIITGGLGPTADDVTTEAIALAADVELVRSEKALSQVRAFFDMIGREMAPINEKQALLPAGAEIITNPEGTAPGFSLSIDGGRVIALPGVPREMRRMVEESVLPGLPELIGPPSPIGSTTLKVYGPGESNLAESLADLFPLPPELQLHSLPVFPEIRLVLEARGADMAESRAMLERFRSEVEARLGRAVFGVDDQTVEERLGSLLLDRGWTLAVAESCTGGLIGGMVTDTPGSSTYFLMGAVTYSNDAKHRVLGIDPEMIDREGAVSEPVARAMAEGVRRAGGADVGISVTGIAGPTGGSPEKPVGTVHVGVALPDDTHHVRLALRGDRDRIRRIASHAALHICRRRVLQCDCESAPGGARRGGR